MNYISEINSFYNWIMLNPIAPDAQALWHLLMQLNNRCAVNVNGEWLWKCEFTVPNSMILSMLAFSRQQLDRMRNVLIQTGRIVYKRGKGSQSGSYKIIPFDNSLIEAHVGNSVDKFWIISQDKFVSHNVTQIDTQIPKIEFVSHNVTQNGENAFVSHNVTQSVTQLDTQHDTQTDTQSGHLCNIIGTLDKLNNNYNNIYNNYNSDCGDYIYKKGVREKILPELDSYIGITDELKLRARLLTQDLFDQYFTRQPSRQDVIKVFECVYACVNGVGSINASKTALLEYAFKAASQSGHDNWAYIEGVLSNLAKRGLSSLDDCENYDIDRDMARQSI